MIKPSETCVRSKPVGTRFLVMAIGVLAITAGGMVPLELLAPRVAIAQGAEAQQKAEADRLLQEGQQLSNQSQYSVALERLQQALGGYVQTGDRRGEGNALYAIGDVYYDQSQYPKALEFYQQSLAVRQDIGDRKNQGITLNDIGLIYVRLGQYPQALESYQQALAIRKEIGDRAGEGTTLNNIGRIYDRLGQYPKALEFYQQALAIRKEVADRSGESTSLNNIGLIYTHLGKYPQALEFYQQALVISQQIGDRLGEANSLNNIGGIYDRLGQYEKALAFYQQALAIRKAIGDHSGESTSLNNIGFIYSRMGQYQKALEFFQQALAIRKEIGDRSGEGQSLNNIGAIYNSLGQYGKALGFYQQALAIRQQISDLAGEGTTLNNIGGIYDNLGQYPQALKFYQQALAISKAIGDRSGEGTRLNNIGGIYDSLGQYSQALAFYQQALAISKAIGDRSGEGTRLNNIGFIYSKMGQYTKALEFYQQALAILKQIGDRSEESSTLNNIGRIYARLGQYQQVLTFYQQALIIRKAIGDRAGEGGTLNNIGARLLESGKAKEAEITLFEAIEAFESLRPGLTDENKVSLFEIQADTYRFQQTALVTQNKFKMALEVAERGRARAFVELLATRINGTETSLPQLTANLRPNITQIKQIAKDRNATLVEYSIIDAKTLYIWVVQPSGTVTYRKVVLPQQPSLTALVDTSRESIGVRGRGNFKIESNQASPADRLKQFHQLLIAPIADLLPIDPSAQVIFVPHGELFLVPFPALQDAKGQYLIEQHTILTAPAIQVLDLTRQKRQQVNQAGLREVVIVGNPTMPQLTKLGELPEQLKALPGSEQEANRIAALFKTKAWIGGQATKAAIVPKLSRARIIHLATHGLLDDLKGLGTPGAIALAPSGNGEPNDGLLTANEILDLKLNAELVVLSACDTGRGKITSDSVIGLSRSLILAGTSSVMVSLWSVPDAPTAELMAEFYHDWQERKLDKAQALRQAMLTIMKRPNAQPRDWAAFTLIGESQ